MTDNKSTLWNRQSKVQMYGGYMIGQVLLAVVFFATGIVELTFGNLMAMIIVGYAAFIGVRFAMNSFVVDESAE